MQKAMRKICCICQSSFLNKKKPKIFLLCLLFFLSGYGQQIFSENFLSKQIDSSWQIITGRWQVANVQDLRIAPAENGYQYVLCAEGPGLIRLIIDIPDTVRVNKLQLQFTYYTYLKGPGASVEIEFHKRDQKDGMKGKLSTVGLPVKGRWIILKKVLSIPSGANSVYLTFTVNKSNANVPQKVCFDVVQAFALK
jgi:hypothetical protein